jgi:hypothetical protein
MYNCYFQSLTMNFKKDINKLYYSQHSTILHKNYYLLLLIFLSYEKKFLFTNNLCTFEMLKFI